MLVPWRERSASLSSTAAPALESAGATHVRLDERTCWPPKRQYSGSGPSKNCSRWSPRSVTNVAPPAKLESGSGPSSESCGGSKKMKVAALSLAGDHCCPLVLTWMVAFAAEGHAGEVHRMLPSTSVAPIVARMPPSVAAKRQTSKSPPAVNVPRMTIRVAPPRGPLAGSIPSTNTGGS
eukprot:3157053-Prymnesium_polylepis.1